MPGACPSTYQRINAGRQTSPLMRSAQQAHQAIERKYCGYQQECGLCGAGADQCSGYAAGQNGAKDVGCFHAPMVRPRLPEGALCVARKPLRLWARWFSGRGKLAGAARRPAIKCAPPDRGDVEWRFSALCLQIRYQGGQFFMVEFQAARLQQRPHLGPDGFGQGIGCGGGRAPLRAQ